MSALNIIGNALAKEVNIQNCLNFVRINGLVIALNARK